jgi:Peptidase C39 family
MSMSLASPAPLSAAAPPVDTGLVALAILAAVHEKPIDVEQAYREYVPPGGLSDRDMLLRAAKQEGFKARHIAVRFDRLATLPLPAIAEATTALSSSWRESTPTAACWSRRSDGRRRGGPRTNSSRGGPAVSSS